MRTSDDKEVHVIDGMALAVSRQSECSDRRSPLIVRLPNGLNLVPHTKAYVLRRVQPGNSRLSAVSVVMRSSPCTCEKFDIDFSDLQRAGLSCLDAQAHRHGSI
jgi:hypothetical protein